MPREGPESSGALFLSCPGDKPAFLFQIKVAQSCQTLCDPMAIQSMEFSRPEYWSGLPFPSPGDLSKPGIEPGSAVLQEDSLPSEPPGTPLIYPKSQNNLHKIIIVGDPSNDIW